MLLKLRRLEAQEIVPGSEKQRNPGERSQRGKKVLSQELNNIISSQVLLLWKLETTRYRNRTQKLLKTLK